MAREDDTMYMIRPVQTEFGSSNIGLTRVAQIANKSGVTTRNAQGGELDPTSIPDPAPWVTGLTYATPSFVSSPDGGLNNVYVALVTPEGAINRDQNPDDEFRLLNNPNAFPKPENPFWQFVRKTANHSLDDERPSITVERPDEIVFKMHCEDDINTISLINIEAGSISYSFRREGVVYTETKDLSNIDGVRNWEDYLFNEVDFARSFTFRNVHRAAHPASTPEDDQLTITIRNPGGVARIGQIVLGNEERIGMVNGDTWRKRLLDFSSVTRDEFGVLQGVKRDATYVMRFQTIFERERTLFVDNLLTDFRGGAPAVFFITLNEFYGTTLYGFSGEGELSFQPATNNKSILSIAIEGLV